MAPNGSAVSGQMTSLMCRQQSGVMTTNSQPIRSLLLVAADLRSQRDMSHQGVLERERQGKPTH